MLFGFHTTAYLWLTVTPGDLHQTGAALSRHPDTTFSAAVTGMANLRVNNRPVAQEGRQRLRSQLTQR